MIGNLQLALRMAALRPNSEWVVSGNVFQQIMENRQHDLSSGLWKLNNPYDSPRFRFMHKVSWNGILFIHFSNQFIIDPLTEAASA